jgi:group I intron endonuclease
MNYAGAGYVYSIKNTVNGHCYIGSTVNYKSRWSTHRGSLRRGKHHSFILQKAWDKYGESAFTFNVLAVCPKEQMFEYETRLMPLQNYNVMKTAHEVGVRGGWKHSEEFKAKISLVHKGKKLSEEHKKNISISKIGYVHNVEFKEKARLRQTGVSPKPETRQKLGDAVKKARALEVEKNIEKTKAIHKICSMGHPVFKTCKENGMSVTSFYKYVAMLELPFFGQKGRGVKL